MNGSVWYLLDDEDRFLYHYTSSAVLLDYIIPTGSIRFLPFKLLNDPRESYEWPLSWHSREGDFPDDMSGIEEAVQSALKSNWCVGCFVRDSDESVMTREREKQGADLLIAPALRGHSHPRMWAQYGDNHAGVCLVFDRAILTRLIGNFCSENLLSVRYGAVEYSVPRLLPKLDEDDPLLVFLDELRSLGVNEYAQRHVERHYRKLYFHKSSDWENEMEYRFSIGSSDSEPKYFQVAGALKGVLMGDKINPEHRSRVAEFAMENTVEIADMSWSAGFPQPHPLHPRLVLNETQKE
ncbi:MAG: DUF2971 domain-containing protein [Rhodobacteraceae bacterium]|nr:DUF2971 domain-containing protein [Paracoccaceae bacterium]